MKGFSFLLFLAAGLTSQLNANNVRYVPQVYFEIVKGMVVVQGELDGTCGNFILDTGAPNLVINRISSTESSLNDIFGTWSAGSAKVESLEWAGIRKEDLQVLTADLSVVEQMTGIQIAGIIGFSFIENHELFLDFGSKTMRLTPNDLATSSTFWKEKCQIPFQLAGHIPVLEMKIGDLTIRLGLDTGASANLLTADKANLVKPEHLILQGEAGVIGLNGSTQVTYTADILQATVGNVSFDAMRFVFSDISHLENLSRHNVDGLLGYPFFSLQKVSINYKEQILTFWE